MENNQTHEARQPIYLQLANELAAQIDASFYHPGDRLPSVRKMAEIRGYSITTVISAYQELEDRSLLTVLPQSGYYVSYRKKNFPLATSFEISKPKSVNVIDLVRQVVHDSEDASLTSLGSGLPPAELLPTAQLNKMLVKSLQSKKIQENVTGTAEGDRTLREQIVKFMFLRNAHIDSDDILITSGCNEAVYLAFASICQAGDYVAVESPCYFGILHILQVLKIKVIEIPSDSNEGIQLEKLQYALDTYDIKAIYVNSNCNNPMGSSIPTENKRELVEIASRYQVPIVEDDSTGELFFGRTRPSIIKSFDTEVLVVYCSSFSKVLSPTYRVGWIIPGKYKEQVSRLKQAINVGTAKLQQLAIAEYLDSGQYERHLRRIRRIYIQKIKTMTQAVLNHFPAETFVSTPQGGFNLWVQMPKTVDSFELYKRAKQLHISIVPGTIFAIDDKYSNFIRLTAAGYGEENEDSLKTIGRLAQELLREKNLGG